MVALFCGLVLPSKMDTRCFPHRTAHLSIPLPPTASRGKTKCKTVSRTHNSVASIHPDGMAGCGGCGERREQQCLVHTHPSGHAPVGRSPALSSSDNTLHTGVGRRREMTPRVPTFKNRWLQKTFGLIIL